jgi:tetratricopeptide (TPR) repeat protein
MLPHAGDAHARKLAPTQGKDAVMVRNGLFVSLCAAWLSALGPGAGSAHGEDTESKLRTQLAIQAALQQGRESLRRGEYQAAVYCLEKEIPRLDGNRDYLNALREAYRGYIRELQQTNRYAEASEYQERLQSLDPGYHIEVNVGRPSSAPASSPPASGPPMTAALAAQMTPDAPPAKTAAKATAPRTARSQKPEDDNPFADSNSVEASSSQGVLDRARREYDARNYAKADRLYQEANHLDSRAAAPYRELWAFCKLYVVTEKVNKSGWFPPTEAEKEVLEALNLCTSPEMQRQGKELLRAIQDRRIEIRHVPKSGNNWPEVETANFRVIYYEARERAEQVARVAEMTRSAVIRKWFGEEPTPWTPKCMIFLYPNANYYARQTGKAVDSPGHSTLQVDKTNVERVIQRRIDLHCDVADMITHVLPHETTHAVLIGRFGRHLLPRWADEGMAILSEPREKVQRYLKRLASLRSRHELFSVSELLGLNDYPEARRVTAFYVQSISLVDFLCSQKGGPQTFTRFIREGLESGFEAALQRHYGFRDFKDLEERWSQAASGLAFSER